MEEKQNARKCHEDLELIGYITTMVKKNAIIDDGNITFLSFRRVPMFSLIKLHSKNSPKERPNDLGSRADV